MQIFKQTNYRNALTSNILISTKLNQNTWKRRKDVPANLAENFSPVSPEAPLPTPRVIKATTRRKHASQSVFCEVCQQTDNKTNDIKLHMGGMRAVQCKSCKLFFTNCN